MDGTFKTAPKLFKQLYYRFRRTPPLYPIEMWNVHEATMTHGDRTNNFCEGWNNGFQSQVGHKHPSIWRAIQHLKEDEAMAYTMLIQEARGQPPQKRQKRATVQTQEKL